jgi:1,4-dihydroxy-2-naphthoate polyprenyltransferase
VREICGGGVGVRIGAWIRVVRLQFYSTAFLAYSLGAVAAVSAGHSLDTGIFWFGYLTMFGIELGTVLINFIGVGPR